MSATLVLGTGISGRAAVGLLRRLGRTVRVYDERLPGSGEPAEPEGPPTFGGPWDPSLLDDIDLVVPSPGIPQWAAPITDAIARRIPVRSELDLACEHVGVPVVAVTGTNGKTTTTELITEMLTRSGVDAVAVGNIGPAASDVAADATSPSPDVVVMEASSFQLRFAEVLRPAVAVVLNIAPDHLDWHGDLAAYAAAKARITERQTVDDIFVHGADDPTVAAIAALTRATVVPVSGSRRPEGGWGPEDEDLVVGPARVPLADLAVADPAYLLDLAAAAAAALAVGATPDAVTATWLAFAPGPHRRSVVARHAGVLWVNDSKATNPHAATAAIAAYPSVVLIAGGRNKGLDLGPMLEATNLRVVLAVGEAGPELAALAPHLVDVVGDLDTAVTAAHRLAKEGDTVLLAPGCASFDQFIDYADRGDHFAALVRRRITEGTP